MIVELILLLSSKLMKILKFLLIAGSIECMYAFEVHNVG